MLAGPPIAAFALFAALFAHAAAAAHIDHVSANVDVPSRTSKHHAAFVPLVAFKCGYRDKHINELGEWEDDASSVAECLTEKTDILKYCKRVRGAKRSI